MRSVDCPLCGLQNARCEVLSLSAPNYRMGAVAHARMKHPKDASNVPTFNPNSILLDVTSVPKTRAAKSPVFCYSFLERTSPVTATKRGGASGARSPDGFSNRP